MLRTTAQGSSVAIIDGGKKLWEVTKGYDRDDFPANAASVGYAIDVYQESINKTARDTSYTQSTGQFQLLAASDNGETGANIPEMNVVVFA